MDITFINKTAIVTGAAHGFGRAISLALAERGAKVWACDIQAEGLAATKTLSQGSIETRVVDVSDKVQVEAFVQDTITQDKTVDILVNNAGGVLGQVGKPLEQVSLAEWQAIFDVNVSAAFYFSQAVAPAMKAARSGRIITISSGAGLGISLTGIQAYASAKAALIGLTRQLAHELGPWQITVNCIAPGFVRSNPTTEKQWQSYGEEGQQALLNAIALKRLGTPQDIANGVMFFASEAANWVSGQVLSVDGGK
jgi:3-oxoacyl-[acyl-carrier protein] reductase